MAFVALRSTFARVNSIGNNFGRQTCGLLLVNCKDMAPIQVATMKATYGEQYPYSKPWPYEKKDFGLINEIYDRSLARLNENSKIILVEGNIGVGKHHLAKRIAEDFDLKYFPGTTDDKAFAFGTTGYDVRDLDQLLPETAQCYDLKKFLADPHPEKGTVGRLQIEWYRARFLDYCQALLHLLSTGQGVVMVRSPFTDMVFPEALRSMGWISKNFLKYYHDVLYSNTICEALWPHVTVYLDAPVHVLQKRIKARNNAMEVNSRNLPDAYLQAISTVYKNKVLPLLRQHGEVLEVDWSEVGDDNDIEVLVEAIQELELESDSNEDLRFHDWFELCDDDVADLRRQYTQRKRLDLLFALPWPWECPEILYSDEDRKALGAVQQTHPVTRYMPGWMPELGDKVLMKLW